MRKLQRFSLALVLLCGCYIQPGDIAPTPTPTPVPTPIPGSVEAAVAKAKATHFQLLGAQYLIVAEQLESGTLKGESETFTFKRDRINTAAKAAMLDLAEIEGDELNDNFTEAAAAKLYRKIGEAMTGGK